MGFVLKSKNPVILAKESTEDLVNNCKSFYII